MWPAMDIDNATRVLEAHADYRVLRRLGIADAHVFAENVAGEPCGRLAVIDTETTGLKAELGDRIIDLAIATCEYGRDTGRLYRVVDRYESLEDPEAPIPPEIVRLTGITDEMVRGQRIDESGIARVLDGVGLVICHNARFDRAFLEARYPAFAGMHFACSLDEIPWDRWNMNSTKLDYIGFRFGLFHEGHRARADVDMLLALLARTAPRRRGRHPVAAAGVGARTVLACPRGRPADREQGLRVGPGLPLERRQVQYFACMVDRDPGREGGAPIPCGHRVQESQGRQADGARALSVPCRASGRRGRPRRGRPAHQSTLGSHEDARPEPVDRGRNQ